MKDTIVDVVRGIAAREPSRLVGTFFTREGAGSVTYAGLYGGACRAGSAMRSCLHGRGRVVIVMLPLGETLLEAFLGSMVAGHLPSLFPTNPSRVALSTLRKSLTDALEHTGAELLVTDADTAHRFFPNGDAPVPFVSPEQWRSNEPIEPVSQSTSDLAFVQHSSGTTGHKKGIAINHEAFFNQVRAYERAIGLGPSDVVASWLPLYHDMGLIACFLMPLVRGVRVLWMSHFHWVARPASFLELISEHKATHCWMPNFALQLMAERVPDRHLAEVSLHSLRSVINCAEPITAGAQDAFCDRFAAHGLRPSAVSTCYAMAENTFAVTQTPLGRAPARITVGLDRFREEGVARTAVYGQASRTFVSSGVALDGVQLRVAGSDGAPLPDAVVGEIWIRTGSMLSDYYQRPDLTRAALRDGWYCTGDLGFVQGRELFVTGRKKDLIIAAGKNLYPQDIEDAVSAVKGIKAGRVAAFGDFDVAIGTETVVVVAEVEPGYEEDVSRIRAAAASAVSAGLGTSLDRLSLVARGTLAKSTSGKISRGRCRDAYVAGGLHELGAPPVRRVSAVGGPPTRAA